MPSLTPPVLDVGSGPVLGAFVTGGTGVFVLGA